MHERRGTARGQSGRLISRALLAPSLAHGAPQWPSLHAGLPVYSRRSNRSVLESRSMAESHAFALLHEPTAIAAAVSSSKWYNTAVRPPTSRGFGLAHRDCICEPGCYLRQRTTYRLSWTRPECETAVRFLVPHDRIDEWQDKTVATGIYRPEKL